MTQLTSVSILQGGLNLVTPAVAVPAGQVMASKNYECEARGYRRASGYERKDGRPRPSDAGYWVLNFDAGSIAVTAGQTVNGQTSGATGKALYDAVVISGSFGTSDAVGYLVLTDVTGEFQDNENIRVSTTPVSVADGEALASGAQNDTDHRTWLKAAVDARRSLIQKLPGEGPVRGVWIFKGDIYAFRDDVGGATCLMYKATPSGWQVQSFGWIIRFTNGSTAFTEGGTLTGGTSGHTAVIRRVIVKSGVWDGSAVGYLVISAPTGTFQNGEALTDGSGGAATANGARVVTTLPGGGRYSFVNHNFYGADNKERMYGANGVGLAFEFDGAYFVPIETGVPTADDKPERVAVVANHLFLSYAGGSLQFSEIGNPTQYKTTNGAGEIGFGNDITDLIQAVSTALIIIGKNKVGYLTGTSASDFALSDLSDTSGGKAYTAQNMGGVLYMDSAGVRRITATQAFGNFRTGAVTQMVEPILNEKARRGVSPVASLRVRSRDIYRLFFSDRSVLSVYIGRKNPECMMLGLPFLASCSCSGVDASGEEMCFVGDSEGWVYEMDRGRSFDGGEVDAWLRLPFNHVGSPTQRKRFSKLTLDMDAPQSIELALTTDFAYGSPYLPAGSEVDVSIAGGGGTWDIAEWNQFLWSSQVVGQAEAYINGFGRNMSATIISISDFEEPHTLNSATINFAYRGLAR